MGSFEISLVEQSRQGHLVLWEVHLHRVSVQVIRCIVSPLVDAFGTHPEPLSPSVTIAGANCCLPQVEHTLGLGLQQPAHILGYLCKLALGFGATLLTQRCENPSIYVSLEQLLPGPVDRAHRV